MPRRSARPPVFVSSWQERGKEPGGEALSKARPLDTFHVEDATFPGHLGEGMPRRRVIDVAEPIVRRAGGRLAYTSRINEELVIRRLLNLLNEDLRVNVSRSSRRMRRRRRRRRRSRRRRRRRRRRRGRGRGRGRRRRTTTKRRRRRKTEEEDEDEDEEKIKE